MSRPLDTAYSLPCRRMGHATIPMAILLGTGYRVQGTGYMVQGTACMDRKALVVDDERVACEGWYMSELIIVKRSMIERPTQCDCERT